MRLQTKVALVTGAGYGLGRAIVLAMAREGASVAIVDIDEMNGKQTAAAIESEGGQALFIRADVSDEMQVKGMIQATADHFGRLDVLVNNVGIISRKDVVECPLEEWQAVFRANVESVFLTAKYCIPIMRDGGGGAIVNISSSAGLVAAPKRPAYCASKGAIIALTRQLAVDYATHKIRVNAVAPSSIEDTGMFQSRPDVLEDPEAVRQALFSSHPLFKGLGRICQAEDVARVVVFLASDEAVMITGVTLSVDGGGTAI